MPVFQNKIANCKDTNIHAPRQAYGLFVYSSGLKNVYIYYG